MPASNDKLKWFREARYGLFIHWGLYSILGRGEQVLFREHLVPSEYRKLAERFNPKKYNPAAWAATAKAAGMKYAVLTTKHHDGFCLFDTATTEYCAPRCAAGSDLVAEYVKAFRNAGLKVGLYFSLADWNYPAYFNGPEKDPKGFKAFRKLVHDQVRELCSQYGKIDVIWFDGEWPHSVAEWQSARLEKTIRSLQPGILINNRLFKRAPGTGDFGTPEQEIPDVHVAKAQPWESCITSVQRWWGWHTGDQFWKSPKDILLALCHAASGGGNLLLNVGPKPDGTFPAPFVRNLQPVGEWLRVNGEAIYGTTGGVSEVSTLGYMTVKKNAAYLLVTYWPGEELHLCGLSNRVRSARVLGHADRVRVERRGEHIGLRNLPRKAPHSTCTVIKLSLDGPARPYPWVAQQPWHKNGPLLADWTTE